LLTDDEIDERAARIIMAVDFKGPEGTARDGE